MKNNQFKDGNIISLTLVNFQTFKNTTFSFSPSLNFIIGPNGSGKSTVSNAISFIFGGTPKTIGKAKQLKDYIRFGEERCKIEANVWFNNKSNVLTRIFTHTSNLFLLDGVGVKKSVYDEFLRSLKININNLCQYLPQERVSEFVRMSAEELLVQTCISLDRQDVIDDLNTVKELEQRLDDVSNKENVINIEKSTVKNFVDAIYKDVEKIKERENKKAKIEMMEIKKIWIGYENMKSDYNRLLNSLRMMKNSYKDNTIEAESIKSEIETIKKSPLNQEMLEKIRDLSQWDDKINQIIIELRRYKTKQAHLEVDLEHLEKKREKNRDEIKVVENEMEKIADNLERERNSIKESFKDKNLLKIKHSEQDGCKKKKIEDERIALDRVMTLFDGINEVNIDSYLKDYDSGNIEDKESKLFEMKRKKNEIQDRCIAVKAEFDELEEKKKKINEESERRMELLKRYHYDTYKAVIWLRDNKSMFKNEIIEPAFLHINIKNEIFTSEIEVFLSFVLLTSFICKDSQDFTLFMKKIKDEQKLKINAIEEIRYVERGEYTREEIKSFGFYGTLNDFIDARKETRDFLITHGYFDSIPITKSKIDEKRIFEKTNIKRLAMDGKYCEIKRSRYNKKDFVVYSSQINPKNLLSKKIDTTEIENRLNELSVAREKYSTELKAVLTEMDSLDKSIKDLSSKKTEYDKEIGAITTRVNLYNMNLNTLKQKEAKLEDLKNENKLDIKKKEIEIEVERCKQQTVNTKNNLIGILRDIKYLDQFKDCMETFRDIRNEFKKLDFLQSNFELLERSKKDLSEKIEEHEKTKIKLKEVLNANKNKLQEVDKKLNEMKENLPVGTEDLQLPITEQMKALPDTLDDLNLEIIKEKTQLKFYNVSEDAKVEYEEKKTQLNKLTEDLYGVVKNKKAYEEKVKKSKQKLIMILKELVESINVQFEILFSKIGCEGKCEFYYANGQENVLCKFWKLSIFVKFRENEKLEILSHFRQSGGEKSVSTILFLLALQKLDHAPFRLVDEINQGMDKYNEKNILNILFEMCNLESATQFFIISPKLVSGLNYNKTMKVLILFSDQPGAVKKAFVQH